MNKHQLLFLLLIFAIAMQPPALHAQPRLPEHYYWQKLSNGLEVIVIENPKVPLTTIEIAVKNGAYTEGPEFSGLSHLFEHMFFKANKDYPDQEKFIQRTEELGMIWNGTTGDERVNYYFTFDKDSLDAGLRFMNAAIRYPIYRVEDMQKERPVVDGEFQRAESDPFFTLWLEVQKKCWGDLVTRKNPIGLHEVINTATPEKMMIIKDKYYFPNNSLLVICGDVKHEAGFATASRIFGDWQSSGFDPHVKYPIPEFVPLQKTEYVVKEMSLAKTPYIMYQWQGPDTRNDSLNTIVADVFHKAMSLNSSKWQQALVDKGLATFASGRYGTERYVGGINLEAIPNPAKLKECISEMDRQIAMMASPGYITDEQLAVAKATIRRDHIRDMEKPSSLASQITYAWCSSSLDYHTDYVKACASVTAEQLSAYAAKYLTGKPHVSGLVINKEMNDMYKPAEYFKN